MRNKKSLLLAALLLLTVIACDSTPEFEELESGLLFRKIEKGDTTKAQTGDVMNMVMTHTLDDTDSTLYDSGTDPGFFVNPFTGLPPNLQEAFLACSAGDSAQIKMTYQEYTNLTGRPFTPADSAKVVYWNFRVREIANQDVVVERLQAKQMDTDRGIIDEYLVNNNLEANFTDEGIAVVTLESGNGEFPENGDLVKVDYTVRLLDGTLIDTSNEALAKENNVFSAQRPGGYKPYEFTLGNREVIEGWDLGVPSVDKGGKAKLLVPSQYAYGARNSGPIPPNSVLVFDIEVVDFE